MYSIVVLSMIVYGGGSMLKIAVHMYVCSMLKLQYICV